MKKKIVTVLAVLFCIALTVALALAIVPSCFKASLLNRTEWILRNNSNVIEDKYGEFDIVGADPDVDGLYKNTTCSYIVQDDKTTMNLFSISFDSNGYAHRCYVERVYANNEDASFQIEIDADRTDLPTRSDAEQIEANMPASELYTILGKPQRDVGSGEIILEWDLSSGEILWVLVCRDLRDSNYYFVQNFEIGKYGFS